MLRRSHCYRLLLGVGLLCIVSLSGCDFLKEIFRFDQDADAQTSPQFDRQVITVVIQAGSFSIETSTIDSDNVTVQNEATIYQGITGDIFFRLSSDQATSSRTFRLVPTDMVIERPGTNLLTLIRQNPS